eukprot:CAMPEP_0117436726 /NCGR_PEP_ID=MMETSP0759-20121206/1155_1 /TAXON_ID=63605 /ORGANISM="Percolomonas cosmopolitus, Strain WS" /LENGTH=685 /DNA_ID=CAMNT_0005228333 /DNA_START=272 /DNA_END=2329 /DNA_ORIENTATION=-
MVRQQEKEVIHIDCGAGGDDVSLNDNDHQYHVNNNNLKRRKRQLVERGQRRREGHSQATINAALIGSSSTTTTTTTTTTSSNLPTGGVAHSASSRFTPVSPLVSSQRITSSHHSSSTVSTRPSYATNKRSQTPLNTPTTTLPLGCGPRCCHRSIHIEPYLIMFGGEDAGSYFQDMHIFNTFTHEWVTPLISSLNQPKARTQHAIIYRKKTHSLVLLYGYAESGHLSDVLECSLKPHPKHWIWKPIITTGTPPPALCGHTGVYQHKSDSIIMFGGGKQGHYQNVVYMLNLITGVWRMCDLLAQSKMLSLHASQVSTRHLCQHDAEEQEFFDYSTQTLSSQAQHQQQVVPHHPHEASLTRQDNNVPSPVVDSYIGEFDGTSQQWSSPTPPVVVPKRGRHTAVLYNDNELYVYGGYSRSLRNIGDCWRFRVDSQKWDRIEPRGDIPSARSNHDTVLIGDFMYLFGGDSKDVNIYYLNLKTYVWTKIECQATPRWGHSIEYRLAGDKIHFYAIAGCDNSKEIVFLDNMDLIELPLPRSLANKWSMKQLMWENVEFQDCVVTTTDDTHTLDWSVAAGDHRFSDCELYSGGTVRDECLAATNHNTSVRLKKRKRIEPHFMELCDDSFGFDSFGEESSSETQQNHLNSVHRPLKKQRITLEPEEESQRMDEEDDENSKNMCTPRNASEYNTL